ncbi:hypothetical protein A5743_24750 [Mycolicibacterium conceptionense]|nr:hypothetical protein A5743_24750 [Mycolicibacterium conceptionense]
MPACDTGAAVLAGVIASLAGSAGDGASGGGAPPDEAACTGVPAESEKPWEKACNGSFGTAPTGA